MDACCSLGALYLERADGASTVIASELLSKALRYLERGAATVQQYRQLIDDGLIGNTEANRQEALEMELKSALGLGRFYSVDRYGDCLSFFDRALLLSTSICDEETKYLHQFAVHQHKGLALGRHGHWDKAIESCFDAQLQIATDHLDDDHAAEAQFNLALACYKMGDYTLGRSTILTCIDTIKVRCVDQTRSAKAEALLKDLFTACERSSEIDGLSSGLASTSDPESRLDYMFQIAKILQKLGRHRDAFEIAKRFPPVLERSPLTASVKSKVFQLIGVLSVELGRWTDAMFFNRKWLELIDADDHATTIACLLLLLRAHIESRSLDDGLLVLAQRCLSLVRDHGDRGKEELEALSHLSLIHEHTGDHVEASRLRDECIGLAMAIEETTESRLAKDYEDVEAASYFGDRKMSCTTKSLMGGDFQMRQRTTKIGAIAKRRVKATSREAAGVQPPKRRTKVLVVHENLESDSDLGDFIAPISSDSEKENQQQRRKRRRPKGARPPAALLLSSDLGEPAHETSDGAPATPSQAASPQPREADTDYYDFGPIPWGADAAQPYRPSALRVTVLVAEHAFVIPCFDDDITERKRIAWLIKEASVRYAELDEKEPIVKALSYMDSDAYLSPNDPVAMVLTEGQTVRAHIEGWRKRSWLQEYRYQLHRLGQPAHEGLEGLLEATRVEHSAFDFTCCEFEPRDLVPFYATLKAKREDYAQFRLNLSCSAGFSLGALGEAVGTRLSHLDLSFTEPDLAGCSGLLASKALLELNLSYTPLDPAAILHALAASGLEGSLEALSLAGYDFSRSDADFEGLQYLCGLRTLNLEASILSTAQVGALAVVLQRSSSLEAAVLQLDSCEQSAALLAGVAMNRSLRTLDLPGTGADVAEHFAQCLAATSLTCLVLPGALPEGLLAALEQRGIACP